MYLYVTHFFKKYKFEISGSCFFALFSFILFFCKFFGGGDLGISASFLDKFTNIIQYTWNSGFELGMHNENALSWLIFYLLISLFDNISSFKYVLFFSIPLIATYILTYRSFYKLHKNSVASFITSIMFLLNPFSVTIYLLIPIQATYYLFPFTAYLFYIFVMINKKEFYFKKILIITLILFPILIIPFSNFAYVLPPIFIFLFLILLNNPGDLKYYIFSLLPIILLSLFFILPLIFSLLSSTSSFGLAVDKSYLLNYVKNESTSIDFFEFFFSFMKSSFWFFNLIFEFLSLFILIISFLPILKNKRKNNTNRLYFTATVIFIIGIFLSKGISYPLEVLNAFFYQLFSPFSFVFRSPFSKFSIITIIGMTIMFYYGVQILMKKKNIFHFVLLILLLNIIVSSVVPREIFSQQGLYSSKNYYKEHFGELQNLLDKYGIQNSERILLFPINYGVFSLYNFSVNEFYRGAANEYIVLDRPVITNYKWGENVFLSKILIHAEAGDIKNLKNDLKIGNIRCAVIDHLKESGEKSRINYSNVLSSLRKIAVIDDVSGPWEILIFNETVGRIYKIENWYEEYNEYKIFPGNTSIIPITITNNEVNVYNDKFQILIPENIVEGRVDFVFQNKIYLNSSDIEIGINLKLDKPEIVKVMYFSLKTKNGVLTFCIPKPYYNTTHEYYINLKNMVKIYNFTVDSPIESANFSIWKTSNINEPLQAEIKRVVFSEKIITFTSSPVKFEYINPTLWKIKINASTEFILSFSEAYSSLWEATIYVDKKYIATTASFSFYNTTNGFLINQTGEIEITLEYKSQRLMYYGLIISVISAFIFIVYILYSYRKIIMLSTHKCIKKIHKYIKNIAIYL